MLILCPSLHDVSAVAVSKDVLITADGTTYENLKEFCFVVHVLRLKLERY